MSIPFKECNSTNYRKGRRDSIKYIVIHYTANNGDTAAGNASYFANTKNLQASAHYFVDENGIYQSVREADTAWHCGGTSYVHKYCRNDNAIGIEICSRKDVGGRYYFKDEAVNNAVILTKELMEKYNIPIGNVIRHYDVTGKVCPAPFVNDAYKWNDFKARLAKEEINVPKTVYSIEGVHVQIIDVPNFKISVCDTKKKNVNASNYFNLGYFAASKDGSTLPVGNLVVDGNIITDAKNQPDWLNTARHKLTTLVIHNDNTAEFVKTDDMMTVPAVKYAISGIPIIRNGYKVSMDEIKQEGYFGNECYHTWHGFLGIRDGRLVYVAAETDFEMMVYLLEVLGIKDAIKVDGGGSFILKNGSFEVSTSENRRINNVGMW